MSAHRARLARRLGNIDHLIRRGENADAPLRELLRDIERSAAQRKRRFDSLPKPTFPDDLPVVARKQEIAQAIIENQVIVLCGQTGSGKTTQLPKICLELGRGVSGLIGHTQPRRVAARTVAARIAQELQSPLGQAVGYKVRFSDQTSPDTFIKLMTDGILLAETQQDRLLEQYDTLIIDEAHERSLNIDFLLGYLKTVLPRRPDLKVIVTSATIDPLRFAEHFRDTRTGKPAPIIEVSGRTYPVDVLYRPLLTDAFATEDSESIDEERDPLSAILDAVDELAKLDANSPSAGNILIFLSSEREIRETAEALRGRPVPGGAIEVLPLYARLGPAEQQRVFGPLPSGVRRRVVLATNVAETSLTVPGIHYVIDPGFARISRYSTRTKVQRLPIEPISRASADQRKGRCGRLAPGVCIRLYAQEDFESRPEFTAPEIQRTNLAGVILQMQALKLGHIDEFPFIDPPEPHTVRDGYQTLHELGAVDLNKQVTDVGRALAKLPVDPRLGRMILAGQREDCVAEVVIIAAALSVPDPRERPIDKQQAADAAHELFRVEEPSDFLSFVKLWHAYHEQLRTFTRSGVRKWCERHFLSWVRMREWLEIHHQLHSLAIEAGLKPSARVAPYERVHRALLTGLLGHVGVRGPAHEHLGPRGVKFSIWPGSALFRKSPQWIAAAEIVQTSKMYARTVAAVQPEWIEELGSHLVTRSYNDPHWDARSGRVMVNERVTLHGLTIVARRRVHFGPIDPDQSRRLFIQHALVEGQFETDAPFFAHNQRMIEQVRRMECKSRKRDLLAGTTERFDFYAARVPAGVFSVPTFERWRQQAERHKPQLLMMTRAHLMRHLAGDITDENFPDTLQIAGLTLKLDYVFDTADSCDGVTVNVPLASLNQLPVRRFDWLVRGMLLEKITALIKSLPKSIRTSFVPAPEFAQKAYEALVVSDAPLTRALGEHLSRITGQPIPADAWQERELPEYLRMNFRVVDDEGRSVMVGRDLPAIQAALAEEARRSLAQIPHALNRDGIAKWDFGDLPQRVEVKHKGMTLSGYPAIIDRGDAVSLRLTDTLETARSLTRGGVRRLLVLDLASEMKYLSQQLPAGLLQRMCVAYAPLGTADDLRKQLLEASVERVFGDTGDIRTHEEFELRLQGCWHRLPTMVNEVSTAAELILKDFQTVSLKLAGKTPLLWTQAVDDVREQIEHLLPREFLTVTPVQWLPHLPRYLKAIGLRLQKLASPGGLQRDEKARVEISPLWLAYLRRSAEHRARGVNDAKLAEFRWMIEELRVSLFAQELRTIAPVSSQRLIKLFEQVAR